MASAGGSWFSSILADAMMPTVWKPRYLGYRTAFGLVGLFGLFFSVTILAYT